MTTLNSWISISYTNKTAQNLIFSFGRDHGFYGRLLTQAVAVLPSLQVRNGNQVLGYNFTPQDGNSLMSSVKAMAHYFARGSGDDPIDVIKVFSRYLYSEV